jgi:predicted MPP superfamily phosphohydrolase
LSFSFMIAAGAVLVHLLIYWRVLRQLPSVRVRRVGVAVLVVMTVVLSGRSVLREAPLPVWRTYEVVAYGWMAIAICIATAVIAGDLVRLVIAARSKLRREPVEDVDVERRDFVTRTLPWGVVAGGGILAGYGTLRAFTAPEVTEVVLPIAKLPRTLDGLSIVHLTDVHVGPFIGRRFIDMLVDETNALRPDLVVITGDLVDGGVDELGRAVAGLGNLRSRFGTFFVTGNHDFYSGADDWTLFLQSIGMNVLRNRRVEVGDAGGTLDLVGVDDWGARKRGGYDLERALAGRDPDRASVLLAHQPANFEAVVAQGVDLQISGHTHGGQIFPMTELVGLRFDYTRGLYRSGESALYVSRGCGFWGPPARIGSPPELVQYVLTSTSS